METEINDIIKKRMITIRDGLENKGFIQGQTFGFGKNDSGWFLWMNIGDTSIFASLEEFDYVRHYRSSISSPETV